MVKNLIKHIPLYLLGVIVSGYMINALASNVVEAVYTKNAA